MYDPAVINTYVCVFCSDTQGGLRTIDNIFLHYDKKIMERRLYPSSSSSPSTAAGTCPCTLHVYVNRHLETSSWFTGIIPTP
jgi:hypothetical protein